MITSSWLGFLGSSASEGTCSSAKHITANETLKGHLSWQELQPTAVWKTHSTFPDHKPCLLFCICTEVGTLLFLWFSPTHPNTPRAFFQNLSCEHLFPFSLSSECSNTEIQSRYFSVILRQLEWGSCSAMYIACQDKEKETGLGGGEGSPAHARIQKFLSMPIRQRTSYLQHCHTDTLARHLLDGNTATTDVMHSVLLPTDRGFKQARIYSNNLAQV